MMSVSSTRVARILALSEPHDDALTCVANAAMRNLGQCVALMETPALLALPRPEPSTGFMCAGDLHESDFWRQPALPDLVNAEPGEVVQGQVVNGAPPPLAQTVKDLARSPNPVDRPDDGPSPELARMFQKRRAGCGGLGLLTALGLGIGAACKPASALVLGLPAIGSASVGLLCCCWAFPRLRCAD